MPLSGGLFPAQPDQAPYSPDALSALLRASTGMGCRVERELTDGWFNTTYRIVVDDGRPAVVKPARPADAAVPCHEPGIMETEAMVYRRLASLPAESVPASALLHAGEEFLVVSWPEGTRWDKAAAGLSPAGEAGLRRELGAITARLHTLTPRDGRFGCPAAASALSADDWRTAFNAMVDALLDDAGRRRSPLGVPAAGLRALVAEGGYALDEVTEPRLVQFGLWPGNIFVDVAADGSAGRLTGLIDHERALGRPGRRYRLYLALVLVVECGPRGYGADRVAYGRGALADAVAGLRALG